MRIVILSALLAMVCTGAFAQSAPSPDKIALAREVVVATGGVSNGVQFADLGVTDHLADQIADLLKQLNLSDGAVNVDLMKAVVRDEYKDYYLPKLIDHTAIQYAEIYTDQELADILYFYRTPSGRAFVDKRKNLLARFSADTNKDLIPMMMRLSMLEYCRRLNCPQAQMNHIDHVTQPALAH